MSKRNDAGYEVMKQRFITIYEVHSGKLTATEGAEKLGVSRKTFYEYMEAMMSAAATALTPGEPGRPKLPEETLRIRQLESEQRRLQAELYELKAISELQATIIEIRNSQLAEREKKRK